MYDKIKPYYGFIVSVVLVLGPLLLFSPYRTFECSMLAIYAIVLMGLNLLIGFNGQISLGHGAFYAMGAYLSAILIPYLGDYYLLVVPISAIFGMVLGFILGRPTLRFEGPYLGLVTLSLAVATPQFISHFEEWTGGTSGLHADDMNIPAWTGMNTDQWFYLVAILTAIVLFYIASNMVKSQFGRAIIAVRDNHVAASTMGINVAKYKIIVFAISVMYACVAGSLLPFVIHYISPGAFGVEISLLFVSAVIVGGLTFRLGPIFGALYILYLPSLASSISLGAPSVVAGLLVILIVILSPGGLTGIVLSLLQQIKNRFNKSM